jgi:RNA polymerase sigma-70 factor, ECF subfamily
MERPIILHAHERSHASDENDENDMVEAAKNDISAFEILYQRYVDRIYRYMRTRSESDEDAADLTQQVFLQALRALPRYNVRGIPFAAWLFRIARHLATDRYRRIRNTISWDLLPDIADEQESLNPEIRLTRAEMYTQVGTYIQKLDPYKRELLALRFAGGLNTKEIAQTVGKSQDAVKKQLTRTIQWLKEQVARELKEQAL